MRISVGLTLLLGLLSAVGPISTDIYLPAFGLIDHEFGRIGAGQISLAAWFVGLAVGQMVQGALADRFGRRLPLLIGTALYTLASVGCALAPSLAVFSVCRLVAAVSGAASMVIPRALIRDVTEGLAAARLLARMTLILGVVPILAPAVGGVLLTVVSWRDLFWGCGVYGLAAAALVWRFLPDTLPVRDRLRQNMTETIIRFISIAREPVFATNVLLGGCAFAAMFTYIGGSASVFTGQFHLSPAQYGVVFGVNACGFVLTSQFSARLAGRYGVDLVMRAGTRLLLAAFGLSAIDAFTGFGGLAGVAAPVFVGRSMCGLMAPLTTVNALSRHRVHAGSASALMGTWQFSLGAIASELVALTAAGGARSMTALMVAFALAVVVMDRLRPVSTLIRETA